MMAVPTLACDFHGAGFGGFYGGGWKPYSPAASLIDPAMNDQIDDTGFAGENFGEPQSSTFVPAMRPPPKPTFSSVAVRASERALARRAQEKRDVETLEDNNQKTAVFTPKASNTDRESVSN